jgi:hypothetical protein
VCMCVHTLYVLSHPRYRPYTTHTHMHTRTLQGYAVNDPERPYVYAWEIVVTSRKKLVMCFAIYFYESPPVQGICV